MNLFLRNIMWVVLVACGLAFVQAPSMGSAVEKDVAYLLAKSEGKRGTASVFALDLDSGETLVSRKAQTMQIPASNMKLLTTSSALSRLGSDFEFRTRVYSQGSVANGTLTGDLCVVGGGDPNLSGRFYDDNPTKLFEDWADSLIKQGIKKVEGDLLYDSTLFGGDAYNPAWPKDHQFLKWYCAEVSALAFNDNCIGVRVVPTKSGQRAKIELVPSTKYVTVINQTTTKPGKRGAEIGIVRDRDANTLTVKGSVYEKATWGYFTDVTVHDPAMFAATVLRETLERKGISITGKIKSHTLVNSEAEEWTVRVDHRAKLADALKVINTNSQNLHAEMLLRQLGVWYAGKGTVLTGGAALKDWLKESELYREGFHVTDGSGLARGNQVSSEMLARLLANMADRDDFEVFKSSLAIGGETGTLKKRFHDKLVKGKMFAKTGYINGVRSLSGYLFVGDRRVAFSILMNGCVYSKKYMDDSVLRLARSLSDHS